MDSNPKQTTRVLSSLLMTHLFLCILNRFSETTFTGTHGGGTHHRSNTPVK
ncbi:hypothetical protein PF003_g25534 [Phytophthora fragariae]|nr:hypothetical protein PF003_g25534 [Phytophthora fragariae]